MTSPLVAVLGKAAADHYWPGTSPIGKQIKPVWRQDWYTVVGVVSEVRQNGLNARPSSISTCRSSSGPRGR